MCVASAGCRSQIHAEQLNYNQKLMVLRKGSLSFYDVEEVAYEIAV